MSYGVTSPYAYDREWAELPDWRDGARRVGGDWVDENTIPDDNEADR